MSAIGYEAHSTKLARRLVHGEFVWIGQGAQNRFRLSCSNSRDGQAVDRRTARRPAAFTTRPGRHLGQMRANGTAPTL
jgi:hypothetical protein